MSAPPPGPRQAGDGVVYDAPGFAARRATIFAVLAACFIVCQCQRSCMAVLAPILVRELDVSADDLGAMTSAFFLAVAVTQIPCGILFDRYGPRLVVGLSLALGIAGGVLFAAGRTAFELTLAQALLGFGTSPVFMGAIVLIGRWWPARRFATVSAAMMAFGYVGNLSATAPFQWAVDLVGWRPAFGAMVAALAVFAAAILAVARDAPPGHAWSARAPEPLSATVAGMREVLAHPAIPGLFGAAFVGYSTGYALRGLWLGPYLLEVHGVSAAGRGWILMAMAALGTGGIFVAGWLAGRAGSPRPVVLAFAGTAALSVAAMGAWPAIGLWPLLALLAVFSAASSFFPAVLEHGRSLFDDRLRGRSLTTINTAVFLGTGITQQVTGRLIEAFPRTASGGYPELAYRSMFLYVAAVAAAGVVVYWLWARAARGGARPERP